MPTTEDFAGGGWRLDLENFESLITGCTVDDSINAMRGSFEADLPDELDYRPHLKAENQGPQGSCQGNSITTVVEKCIYQSTGDKVQLSRQYAYIESQKKARGLYGTDSGSCVEHGVEVAFEGLPLEELWPYPNPVQYQTKPPTGNLQEIKNQASYRVKKRYHLKDPDAVMTFLEADEGGVHIGIRWIDSMRQAGEYVSSYSGGGRGGHSICLIGYKTVRGTRCPRLFNSHGVRYGDKGTTVVGRKALDTMFKYPDTIMVGVSAYDSPEPRYHNYEKKPTSR